MKNCASVSIYESLRHCKGETTLPGLRNKAYAIAKDDVVKFPSLPSPDSENATMASIATYVGNFTLAADKKFIIVDLIDTASNLVSNPQGEKPSKTFLNTATLKYAGNNEKAAGFARMANAEDFIFIVQQRDGKYRVIGSEAFESNTDVAQDSGMAVTDASGTTITVSCTDMLPAPYYIGKIPTEEGVIDCSTGEIAAEAGD